MTDIPISWLMIEPGWTVEAADGEEIGRVEEVTGDSNADIFDGLSIARGLLGHQLYVPSEHVGEIVSGRVRLTLDSAGVESLGEEDEPAVQEQISGERASLLQRAETAIDPPANTRPKQVGLTRRVLEWFGLAGRR